MDQDRPGERLSDEPEGTPEYSADTENYADGVSEYASGAPRKDPFWERLGFDTWDAYMEYLRRQQSMYDRPPPVEDAVSTTGLPVRTRERRSRQVNFKLLAEEGADLDRVAKVYGVPPATLARMLVNRGVQLIVEELDG